MSSSSAHILNTRPSGQQQAFTGALEVLGFTVSHLPCLAITGVPGQLLEKDPAESVDHVLFTSANAVRFAQAQRPFPWSNVAVHAIGAATATALQALHQSLAMQPLAPFNSEACLAQLARLRPARLLLIKGEGGRGLITSQLRAMGWQVTEMDLYRRDIPEVDSMTMDRIFAGTPPDMISITSNESLTNLVTLAENYLPVLLSIPLVVNSERAAEQAVHTGFRMRPLVANPAGDQGQIDVIRQYFRTR